MDIAIMLTVVLTVLALLNIGIVIVDYRISKHNDHVLELLEEKKREIWAALEGRD